MHGWWWTGQTYRASGVWLWQDDQPLSYTNWGTGQPNSYSENCVALDIFQFDGWHDIACHALINIICEL